MANKFFRKLNGLLTAAALCVSCLPFGGMLSASAADGEETIGVDRHTSSGTADTGS